jgi:hypothetical protein
VRSLSPTGFQSAWISRAKAQNSYTSSVVGPAVLANGPNFSTLREDFLLLRGVFGSVLCAALARLGRICFSVAIEPNNYGTELLNCLMTQRPVIFFKAGL